MSTVNLVAAPSTTSATAAPSYNYAMGYLKAGIVALVVAHHAVLAYHPSAPPIPASLLSQPRVWQAFPVVDSHRALWAAIFATVNDIFFMALMFFVSGLFVWNSLKRKGAGAYLRDRSLRLGLPFIVVAATIAPLSYYPTYLQIAGHGSFGDFLHDWLSLGRWSAGPVWFTWVLLVFDCAVVLLNRLAPGWGEALGRLTQNAKDHPQRFAVQLIAVTTAIYFPVALVAGPFDWAGLGPFWFQTSRILLYFAYFLAGVGVGAWGLERSLTASDGQLQRHWRIWIRWAVLAFLVYAMALQAAVTHSIPHNWREGLQSWTWLATLALFATSCAASSFALLAIFTRFVNTRVSLLESLNRNSYGIFLVHFVFVSWLGYGMLGFALPAIVKFLVVFAGSLALSWGITICLRRIPGMKRIV